jgi:hypothetical protein
MKIKIYDMTNLIDDKREWYWRERRRGRFFGPEHGPFPSRAEARDAGGAAKITAAAEKKVVA